MSKEVKPRVHILIRRRGRTLFSQVIETLPVHFGRNPACEVPLNLDFISRRHGLISFNGRELVVTNLGSQNKFFWREQFCDEIKIVGRETFQINEVEFDVRLEIPTETLATVERGSPDAATRAIPVTYKPETVTTTHLDYTGGSQGRMAMDPSGAVSWQLDPELREAHGKELCVQGLVEWESTLFDVRNYLLGDKFKIGNKLESEFSLPALNKPISLGRFGAQGASFSLPADLTWTVEKSGEMLTLEQLIAANRITQDKKKIYFTLEKEEILTLEFAPGFRSRFRYVKRVPPFVDRSWIENKEEFKKAIQVSMAAHFVASIVALLAAPRSKAPEVANVPQRFAKLLVEPPKQVFAPPPPPPEPPPPEPPAPPPPEEKPPEIKVVEKPPEPPPEKPKEKPKPKKPKKPLQAEKPNNLPPSEPVKPKPPVGQPTPPSVGVAQATKPEEPVRAEPTPEQKEAAAMANLFNQMPAPGAAGANLPSNIKIVKSGGAAVPGVKVSGMVNNVQREAGSPVSGIGNAPSVLTKAGQGGYEQSAGGKAGKRGVVGVRAETPRFKGTAQGLNQDEIMNEVNKHLAQIQQCYERALFENPSLVGRIEYEWSITPAGRVEDASVKRADVGGADFLNGCVIKVIKAMNFPSAKNGLYTVASVGFPFGKQ